MELDDKVINDNLKKLIKVVKKKIAEDIQKGIYKFSYNYAEENNTPFLFEEIYQTKFEDILCILKKSKKLKKSLENGDINPLELAFLKPEELDPDKYSEIIKKKEIEEFKKKNEATTNAYKCPKCKKRKCTVTEKQTRSGDEPATVYVTCKECKHSFSF